MAVLAQLEPKAVFHYFEEICGIPHESSDTQAISDYLVAFAKERNLYVRQDTLGNVIIKKPATSGYEDAPVVMLQGHMDMVCEKTDDKEIDFHTQGLDLVLDGNVIRADRTTLGGDDGIAVAFALAILDAADIPHPALEVVITVDEEIGMLGAAGITTDDLQASYMLNLDSEDEGQLLVGCAGGMTAVDTMNHFFLNKEMIVAGSTYWNMVYGREIGDVLKDNEGIANMRNLGQNMASILFKLN